MIAVTSTDAVRSVISETTLPETIVLIVPGIRFRMLVLIEEFPSRCDVMRDEKLNAAAICARQDFGISVRL